MSGSNWGWISKAGLGLATFTAIGLAVSIWNDASFHEQIGQVEAEQNSSNYADSTRIDAEARCQDAADDMKAHCIHEVQQAARPEQRDEYDLEAQRTMAAWTKAMGKAAIIGMFVGILGVGLIWVTFRETRRTAEVAKDNLDALYESERAIIHAVSGDVGELSGQKRHTVAIEFRNKGRSPARIIEIGVDAPISDSRPNDAPRWTIIPAGGSEFVSGFTPPDKNTILKTDCWVRYKSVGPKIYTSHFTAQVWWHDRQDYDIITQPKWIVVVSNSSGHPDDT